MPLSRRHFCWSTAALLGTTCARAQQGAATSRPDVAAIDRDRILQAADRALRVPIPTLPPTAIPPASSSPGPDGAPATVPPPPAALEGPRAAALLGFTLAVPALAAAAHLVQAEDPAKAQSYARHAAQGLDAWFAAPATRLAPSIAPISGTGATQPPADLGAAAALAEVARALPFLASSTAVTEEQIKSWRAWYADFAAWLDTARIAGLARDTKDHTASAWLLLRCSCATVAGDDTALAALRHRFRSVTLRAQIRADGTFPHELTTATPYRNSLFNLDLLAASADLLSTRFETVWTEELQDGPGMRAAIARHAPWIADRASWPYPADTELFNLLPCRRPSLLLAARAFQRADYATIWRSLNPDPANPALLVAFPLRQPLLWIARPRTRPSS